MATDGGITILDRSGELTNTQLRAAAGTTAAAAAQAFKTIYENAKTNALVGGVLQYGYGREKTTGGATTMNDYAERENKWRVRYRDTLQYLDAPTNTIQNPDYNRGFGFEIGTALANAKPANTDFLDLSAGAGLALKNDIEANVVARSGGAIEVLSVEFVGRSI